MRMVISTLLLAAMALPVAANAQTAPPPAPAPAPSAEVEALGRQIAENGTLAALLALMIPKDIEDLVAKHPELDAAGKDRLRATATALATAKRSELMTALGHQYATRLSLADLKALAAFVASDVAKRRAAVEPMVIAAAIPVLDKFDLQKTAWAEFCKDPASKCVAEK